MRRDGQTRANQNALSKMWTELHTDVFFAGIFPEKAIQGQNSGQMGACFVMEILII